MFVICGVLVCLRCLEFCCLEFLCVGVGLVVGWFGLVLLEFEYFGCVVWMVGFAWVWFVCLKLCVCFSCLGLFGLCMLFMIWVVCFGLGWWWILFGGMWFVVL